MPPDPLHEFLRHPDRTGFDRVVREMEGPMGRAAERLLGDRHLAEDVCQEVFLRLLRQPPHPHPARCGPAWLVSTTLLLARTRRRSEVRRRVREQEAPPVRSDAMDADPETRLDVHEAVAALPGTLQECVELRYFAGLGAAEVATATGVSRRTVDERLAEARQQLERRLSRTALGFLVSVPDVGVDAPFLSETVRASLAKSAAAHLPAATMGAGAWVAGAIVLLLAAFGTSRVWIGVTEPVDAQGPVATVHSSRQQDMVSPTATTSPTQAPDSRVALVTDPPIPTRAVDDAAPLVAVTPDPAPHFVLRVEVEDGVRLRRARVDLEPAGLASLSLLLDEDLAPQLLPVAWLLEPQWVPVAKPLVVEELPKALDGHRFRARATAEGLPPAQVEFTVDRNAGTEVVLRLGAPRRLSVQVQDADSGAPIPEALVASRSEQARTDAGGRALLEGLGAGAHLVRASAPGYFPAEQDCSTEAPVETIHLRPVTETATLSVQVHGPAGPWPGVRVELRGEGGHQAEQLTDEDGRVRWPDVPAGMASACIDLSLEQVRHASEVLGREWIDRTTYQRTEFLEGGQERHADLGLVPVPATGTLEVQLRGPQGQVLAEQEITVHGVVARSQVSDRAGLARFEELPIGTWTIAVGEGVGRWSSQDLTVEADRTATYTWQVGPHTLRGQVLRTEDDQPLPALVFVMGERTCMLRCDAAGRFAVDGVGPGTWTVSAHAEGRDPAEVTLTLGASAPRPLELRLAPGR